MVRLLITFYCISCFYSLCGASLTISSQGKIDFGSYSAEENRTHTFTLTNRSCRRIKIIKIRSTCNCLINNISAPEIPPGESIQIQVSVKGNTVTGGFIKSVYLETNSPGQRFVRLELRGRAIPLIQIKPGAQIYAGKLKAGREYVFLFDLIPSRPEIELSSASVPELLVTKTEAGWRAQCKLTPSSGGGIYEKKYYVRIEKPTGRPLLQLQIRGSID